MNLTDKQLEEFREIYKEVVGEELSEAEAREIGVNITRLVRDTYSFKS